CWRNCPPGWIPAARTANTTPACGTDPCSPRRSGWPMPATASKPGASRAPISRWGSEGKKEKPGSECNFSSCAPVAASGVGEELHSDPGFLSEAGRRRRIALPAQEIQRRVHPGCDLAAFQVQLRVVLLAGKAQVHARAVLAQGTDGAEVHAIRAADMVVAGHRRELRLGDLAGGRVAYRQPGVGDFADQVGAAGRDRVGIDDRRQRVELRTQAVA